MHGCSRYGGGLVGPQPRAGWRHHDCLKLVRDQGALDGRLAALGGAGVGEREQEAHERGDDEDGDAAYQWAFANEMPAIRRASVSFVL